MLYNKSKKIQIYEQASCCAKNGVSQEELDRISECVEQLSFIDIQVERYNLSSSPMEFVNNQVIHKLLYEKGISQLPITVVDGEIKFIMRYPTNEELNSILE